MTRRARRVLVPSPAAKQVPVNDDGLRALLDHLGRLLAEEYVELLNRPVPDSDDSSPGGDR